jgi:hypothetical protein
LPSRSRSTSGSVDNGGTLKFCIRKGTAKGIELKLER